MSAITAPEMAIGTDPKLPAKKRRMIKVWMFLAPAAPAENTVRKKELRMKITRRPYISLSGAQTSGPTANPMTKRDIPRRASSSLIWKYSIISTVEPEYAEETRATTNVPIETREVMAHFDEFLKSIGFRGSSSIQDTINGSSSVPLPGYE